MTWRRPQGLFGLLVTVIILGGPLVVYGCASAPTPSPTPSPTPTPTPSGLSFARDIQPIFNANCVVCHQGANGPGGLSLEPASAYKNLVNVKSTESPLMRVAPDKSYIINKLLGTQGQAGGSGVQMPFGAAPLPQATVNVIQQWISQGAPNN